uniref:hypothetical protein n=1 Tax=Niveispirillum sp. TaxID=1917217 RepID=UPI003BA4AAD7
HAMTLGGRRPPARRPVPAQAKPPDGGARRWFYVENRTGSAVPWFRFAGGLAIKAKVKEFHQKSGSL